MNHKEAAALLAQYGQEHVLAGWKKLGRKAQADLLAQIAGIDFTEVARCRALLPAFGKEAAAAKGPKETAPKAPKVTVLKGKARERARHAGLEAIRKGTVGVVMVAGGQGSRLGFAGPKGAYELKLAWPHRSSLFELHAQHLLEIQTWANGDPIPFYVMTSEANDEATRRFFKSRGHFRLDPDQVFFFKQGTWPAMDDAGKFILDKPGHIFMSPDGHGGMIAALEKSGAFEDMKRRGVKTLFYCQVDNPLVDIADPAFIGHHLQAKAQYSLKVCAKRDPKEGLGVPVVRRKTYSMIEYTEMTDAMSNRRTASGELYFKYGSPAIHVFDVAFLRKEAKKALPLHLAHKKIACLGPKGKILTPSEPNGWKFEKFIFDALPDAARVTLLAFDRADEFSPVKNAEGADSPATCTADLMAKWRRQLSARGVRIGDSVPFLYNSQIGTIILAPEALYSLYSRAPRPYVSEALGISDFCCISK